MRLTRAKILLLLAYVATMVAVVATLLAARRSALATLDTPQAHEQWRAWKAETERQKKTGGPIDRRTVRSDEPPALILLRDRFPAILVTSLLIGSFLFMFLAFVAWGAFRNGAT
jgi:hypothetical protein